VKAYLTSQGLDGSLLKTVGYGENRQVVPGAQRDDQGADQNRRVVFVIESRGTGAAAAPVTSTN
jgi:outer membrane protein OmpA-like peptidoglycan-associated protein